MMSAPLPRTSAGFIALTVAAVPTGMNAGVRISPRCMAITPVRAAPSVAAIVKAKRVMGALPSGRIGARLQMRAMSSPQDADALFKAAEHRLRGIDGPVDLKAANRLMSQAAAKGLVEAQRAQA